MACCQKQSQVYLILTNLLFFICGCGLLAFGMMATQAKFNDAILIPINILKMITILGLILIFTSLVGILGGFYRERRAIHLLYTTLVLVAFIYQISIAVIVYDQAAHIPNWLSDTWNDSSREYKLFAQKKFSCCGFSHTLDHPVATPTCMPDHVVNSAQPCYELLTHFIRADLSHIYIALFTGLAIELLALCNVITHLCSIDNMTRRKWEVSPEEQRKYVHDYNLSADTLVAPPSIQSKSRQF
ncbi:Tetraspanin family-domain-containing protein [Mucor mucedo]|uniref:Tetraspanin family-domain-containing protein n=1 Tax=Mucor mucedo TaxID=29922 RepID=UPI00222019E8|nr:Tetraspanin family-domain-containing protein [Mucor mucedo]KAI7888080.1 Tetraspanin family-domain-containing protein [Mucor mucedo]